MRFGELGGAVLFGAALLNPGMLAVAGITYIAGKMAAAEYRDEVYRSDRLIKANYDGNKDDQTANCAAASTASIAETMAIPSCGLSAIALHCETCRMRKLRNQAERKAYECMARDMVNKTKRHNLVLGY